MDDWLDRYAAWLDVRAGMLVRWFGCDQEDAWQELALGLVEYQSQKTSWLRAFRLFHRESKNRGLARVPPDVRPLVCNMGDMAHIPDEGDRSGWLVEFREYITEHLMPDELELVDAYLAGHTQQEMAEMMGVSIRTVNRMLAEIRLVLGTGED